MTFQPFSPLDANGVIKVSISAVSSNGYVELVKQITKEKDIEVIGNGFAKLFQNVLDANNTYLPNSQKMIPFYEELLVLFWKFLEANPVFRKHVCSMFEFQKFLIPILFIFQQGCKDTSM